MSARTILDSMTEVLIQGEILLMAMDDQAYATKIPAAFNASVGGHYRHCLDHFRCVFEGLETDVAEINYDNRKRDPRIETVREIALAHTRELLRTSEQLEECQLERFAWARSKVSYIGDESPSARSTVGREIMYCVVHAVHHYALVSVMCSMMDVPLPEGFGVAPSTVKHNQDAAKLAA
ncbi:MAG TPA: DinB family protein [Chthoniobacterales bacterium]